MGDLPVPYWGNWGDLPTACMAGQYMHGSNWIQFHLNSIVHQGCERMPSL